MPALGAESSFMGACVCLRLRVFVCVASRGLRWEQASLSPRDVLAPCQHCAPSTASAPCPGSRRSLPTLASCRRWALLPALLARPSMRMHQRRPRARARARRSRWVGGWWWVTQYWSGLVRSVIQISTITALRPFCCPSLEHSGLAELLPRFHMLNVQQWLSFYVW
jgi:hypothetical protein